jgi:hypothetical protein
LVFVLVRMANNMPELLGTGYPRAGLLRRVGRLEQVAGVRLVTLGDGLSRGVRAVAAVVHESAKPEEAFEEFVRPQAQACAQARAQAT